jgi:hypothetical protein
MICGLDGLQVVWTIVFVGMIFMECARHNRVLELSGGPGTRATMAKQWSEVIKY